MAAHYDFTQPVRRRQWMWQLLQPLDETKWEALARELFAWQFARVPAFRRLCLAHGVEPKTLRSWREIPAVPQALFKREMLYVAGLPKPTAIYETSGTTTGQPGRQHLSSIDLYRAVSVAGARRAGFIDKEVGHRFELHFLTPSPIDAPHSSLSAMFGYWQKLFLQTGPQFWVQHDRFDFAGFRETLMKQIKARRRIGICGTAFSFVHLLDAWVHLPALKLPRGSWLLETGGFKGRSREISKAELYAQLARIFTVDDDAIYNEYGMSELSSQAYAKGTKGIHQTPPWARVLVIDPATGREVRAGQKGLVRWIDLANVDSVMALQTLDVAERTHSGFNLIGRLPRTEPRGCSLSAEDLVTHNGGAP